MRKALLFQFVDDFLENVTALLKIVEHAPACTGGGEQHRIAAAGERAAKLQRFKQKIRLDRLGIVNTEL